MFTFLKRRLARFEADTETVSLLAGLATQQLFILSLNPSGEFRGDPSSTEEVMAWIEQNARETADGRPIDIYFYEEGGQRLTPFFSSSANVTTFVESDPAHKWKAFTSAGLTGTTLFKYLSQAASDGSSIVLDPRSGDERPISPDALQSVVATELGR